MLKYPNKATHLRFARRCRNLAHTLLLACLSSSCVFVPVTTEVYDPDCRILSKHVELQPVQIAALGNCRDEQCAAILALMGATAAASAVISGSIVVTGKVVYWFEKQGNCLRKN